jgi:hypothetical protein
MISNKVMKIDEWEDTAIYKINCGCNSDDCDAVISFGINDIDKFPELEMQWDVKVSKSFWYQPYENNKLLRWIKRLKNKYIAIFEILFNDYTQFRDGLMFTDLEHIDTVIEALTEGRNKIKKYQDILKEKYEKEKFLRKEL